MNTAGWLRQGGRQPWIVQGLRLILDAVTPSNTVTTIVISLSVFVLLYAILGVVDFLYSVPLRPQGAGARRHRDRGRTPALTSPTEVSA